MLSVLSVLIPLRPLIFVHTNLLPTASIFVKRLSSGCQNQLTLPSHTKGRKWVWGEILQPHHSLAKIIRRCVLYYFLELPCRSKLQLPTAIAGLIMGRTGCLPFPQPPPHSLASVPAHPKSILCVHQPLSKGVLLGRTDFEGVAASWEGAS